LEVKKENVIHINSSTSSIEDKINYLNHLNPIELLRLFQSRILLNDSSDDEEPYYNGGYSSD
jgi:hypothetical protein